MKTTIISSLITIVAGLLNIVSVSALTYQTKTPVQFTFNPTLSIDLSSSDIYISNLAPGTASDSNIVTISVNTNTTFGYVLSATAGIKGGNTNLVNTMDSSYQFTNLATTAGAASTLSNIPDNYWGYAYSTDSGSTWISGSVGSTATGYAGLPLDANDSEEALGQGGTTLLSTDSASDSRSIQFKIGAKSSATQAAGSYTNTINFYTVANSAPESVVPGECTNAETCMQTMTKATCPTTATTVTDARDGTTYKVQKLADNNCWMLDNLRLDPTTVSLSTLQGNTNASNQTLTYLKNGGGSGQYPASGVSNAWTSSSQNKYDLPYINAASKDTTVTSYGAGSGKVGVYYNYCAASAGSYCYASGAGTGNATEDLCPAGWRMPTGGSSGEYQALHTAYSSNATNFRNALSTPLSGRFDDGSADGQGDYGYFWSSTIGDGDRMYYLYVDSDYAFPTGYYRRLVGSSMRCILDD